MTQPDLSRGNCATLTDPEVMTPDYGRGEVGKHEAEDNARRVCRGCPVFDECRVWAISEARYIGGVAGGLTQPERLRLSGASGRVPRPTLGHRW